MSAAEDFIKLLKRHRFSGVFINETTKQHHIQGSAPSPRWVLMTTATPTQTAAPTECLDPKKKTFGDKQTEQWTTTIVPFCEKAVAADAPPALIIVEGPSGMEVFKTPGVAFGVVEEYYARVASPPKEKKKRAPRKRPALEIVEDDTGTIVKNPSAKMRKCISVKGWLAEDQGTAAVHLKGVTGVTNEIKEWQQVIESGKVPTIVAVAAVKVTSEAATQDME